MKRLTGKYKNGTAYYNIVPGESTIERLAAIEDILGDDYNLDYLRELVEANQEGRVIVLPCKVGDTVYYTERKMVKEATVEEIYTGDGTIALGVSRGFTLFTLQESEFFLTREDAEIALKGEYNG